MGSKHLGKWTQLHDDGEVWTSSRIAAAGPYLEGAPRGCPGSEIVMWWRMENGEWIGLHVADNGLGCETCGYGGGVDQEWWRWTPSSPEGGHGG